MKKEKIYSKCDINTLPGSKVEIKAVIKAEIFDSFRKDALESINQEVQIDGFRKGKAPEDVLVKKIGEAHVLEETAEKAIQHAYPQIIIENKIDALGTPQITITKLAKNNDLEFTVVIATYPKFDLPDYKKIADKEIKKGLDSHEVSDKELEKVIEEVRTSRAEEALHQTSGDEAQHDHNHKPHTKEDLAPFMPEFNDEFVKGLGKFESIEDFKTKVRKNISEEKKYRAQEKKRLEIIKAISEETKIELPDIMIDREISRSEAQFKDDLARMNIKLEDYLTHIKKTIEDLRSEWKISAEQKAKSQIILNAIATKESIKAKPEDIEKEAELILNHYKHADKEQARVYAETVLVNEAVFKMLENQN